MDVSLSPAQCGYKWGKTIKPGGITTGIVGIPVVTGKNDQRVFIFTCFFQLPDDFTHLIVQVRNHGRIGSMRIPCGEITLLSGVRLFITDFFYILIHPFLRCLQGEVGQGGGKIEKEGLAF